LAVTIISPTPTRWKIAAEIIPISYGGLETGGNVWGAFVPKDEEGKRTLFNVPLTQFIRVEADLRDYYKITRNLIWANRLNLGYGYAYGQLDLIAIC
jgi:hypothetical protein